MRRALPIALALILGLIAGRVSAGDPTSSPTPDPGSPGPTRYTSGGVGVGFAHTSAGAIAASASYQQAFADTALLRSGELRRRVEVVATPQFAPTMLAANKPGAYRLTKGALGEGWREKTPTAYFGAPVFYRLASYSPHRAVIRSWGFTIVGNASTAEPSAYFGSSRMELVWTEGDWKIAHTRASYGPTPRLATPRESGEGFGLVDLIDGMRPYVVGP